MVHKNLNSGKLSLKDITVLKNQLTLIEQVCLDDFVQVESPETNHN